MDSFREILHDLHDELVRRMSEQARTAAERFSTLEPELGRQASARADAYTQSAALVAEAFQRLSALGRRPEGDPVAAVEGCPRCGGNVHAICAACGQDADIV